METMNATNLREWIIGKVKAGMPYVTASEPFSQADCDLMNDWLIGQIESRITLKVCEEIAVLDDPDRSMHELTAVASRVMNDIELELQQNIAGSLLTGPDGAVYVDNRKLRLWLQHPADTKPPQ